MTRFAINEVVRVEPPEGSPRAELRGATGAVVSIFDHDGKAPSYAVAIDNRVDEVWEVPEAELVATGTRRRPEDYEPPTGRDDVESTAAPSRLSVSPARAEAEFLTLLALGCVAYVTQDWSEAVAGALGIFLYFAVGLMMWRHGDALAAANSHRIRQVFGEKVARRSLRSSGASFQAIGLVSLLAVPILLVLKLVLG